ncbi:MAG: NAD(P)(+) transhydrogenase (Re/Si-specific) subunit beta [Alphaproteobacteria bacterium]|nr:NAD(P)(+) transhydrogenase (Re/Si-specific) subunit beta [Alphaproteobacteria bacterium]
MTESIVSASYLFAGLLFILSIRGLASPETARRGNFFGFMGTMIAIAATLYSPVTNEYLWVFLAILLGAIVGIFSALKVKMTSLPQMIALLNGTGSLVSVLIALAEIRNGSIAYFELIMGLVIGAIAFTGSLVAFSKLQGLWFAKRRGFFMQKTVNLALILGMLFLGIAFYQTQNMNYFYALAGIALVFGITAVAPIGGADMPVVISLLNSYSGWALVFVGFSLSNVLLIIVGSMVGASGLILSYIMSKAMNRSLRNILLGGFGKRAVTSQQDDEEKYAKTGSPEDAAFIMKNASKVIIVPGYGMAVSQAQHIVESLSKLLEKNGVEVKFAIHPVAGRMPGHMNVLLAEANVPYEKVFELEEINREFSTADVAYVIGANDVTNPVAKTDSNSPIFGMPVLDVEKAKTVFFVKRSLNSGYSGVDNPLFYHENTSMLYGDAKKVTEQVVAALEKA